MTLSWCRCLLMHFFMKFVLVIFSAVERFQDLVPALVSCFQESCSLIRLIPAIDTQSFDCLLCTLRCINLLVTLFVEKLNRLCARPVHLTSLPDGSPYDMLVLLKKLWETFPIGQMHHSTTKVCFNVLLLYFYYEFWNCLSLLSISLVLWWICSPWNYSGYNYVWSYPPFTFFSVLWN